MKRAKWYLVLLLVSILLLVGGCGPTEEPPEESPAVPSTIPIPSAGYSDVFIPIGEFQSQPHIDVEMHGVVGGEFTVVLGSNPTTGYQWSEEAEISDENIIKQISHAFVEPEIDKPPGTPGEEAWTFKALEKGTTTILLEYSRPWVEEDALHWTVTITTNIK